MKIKNFAGTFIAAMLGGAVTLGSYLFIESHPSAKASYYENQQELPVQYAGYSPSGTYNTTGPDFRIAAATTVHAVVHIKTQYTSKNTYYDQYFWDPFFEFFRNPYQNSPLIGAGSGVIISENGYIITNNHVVQDADIIEVTLNDKKSYEAKVIGTDPSTDIALIKIEAEKLPYIEYGNSDEVQVGDWVLAVGNPFNLTSTVTAGIVSAKARQINILGTQSAVESYIQTDAAVNPGNSGGALVDINGKLVGLNAAIATNTGSYTGYSFAIPVSLVKKVVEDIIEFGSVQRAYLGAEIVDMDSKFAKEKGIEDIKGVYVENVNPGSAAEKAGIKQGDLILRIGNMQVNSESEYREALARHRPGDKLDIVVLRNGSENKAEVVLEQKKELPGAGKPASSTNGADIGAIFKLPDSQVLQKLGLKYGVEIAKLENGKLLNAGIKEGFIITAVDHRSVKSVEELNDYLAAKKGSILIEGVYPNGLQAYYSFGL